MGKCYFNSRREEGGMSRHKSPEERDPQMNTANSLEVSNFESGRIHEECDWIHIRGWKDVLGATESIWAEKTHKQKTHKSHLEVTMVWRLDLQVRVEAISQLLYRIPGFA